MDICQASFSPAGALGPFANLTLKEPRMEYQGNSEALALKGMGHRNSVGACHFYKDSGSAEKLQPSGLSCLLEAIDTVPEADSQPASRMLQRHHSMPNAALYPDNFNRAASPISPAHLLTELLAKRRMSPIYQFDMGGFKRAIAPQTAYYGAPGYFKDSEDLTRTSPMHYYQRFMDKSSNVVPMDMSDIKWALKPQRSFCSLIVEALLSSSPSYMLTLSEIYEYIQSKYVYYRNFAKASWKNSIRHNLSLNKGIFIKVRKDPESDSGRGGYWKLRDEAIQNLVARNIKTPEAFCAEKKFIFINEKIPPETCNIENKI